MVRKTRLWQAGIGLILWIIVLTFTTGTSMSALAAPRPASGKSAAVQKSVSHQFTTQQQRAALTYWTPARMESAIPIDTPVATVHEQQQKAPAETATTIAPYIPHGMHVAKPGKIQPDAYQLPQADYRYFPYSTIGKVFFTQNGLNYVCSGTAVNGTNKSVVDTAGHCVIAGGSGNHWSSNFMFCPQYYYGSCPYGEWAARQLWTLNYWASYGWLEEDYGDAVMSPNGYGDVVNVVGGTGTARNFSYSQYFYAFGYPQASPFDGNTMWYCPSGLYREDNPSPGDAAALGITCNMTGGASGGGWLISYNGTFGYVNGHNDYKYNNDANHMYSPYYGNDWFMVFNSAQNS